MVQCMATTAEPTNNWLIVKPYLHEQATHIFEGTGVNITIRGKKQLVAVIGEFEHKHEFITDLVDRWVKQINMLANIAASIVCRIYELSKASVHILYANNSWYIGATSAA